MAVLIAGEHASETCHILADQESERCDKMEIEIIFPQQPSLSDQLLLTRSNLLKLAYTPKTALPAGDQMFRHIGL